MLFSRITATMDACSSSRTNRKAASVRASGAHQTNLHAMECWAWLEAVLLLRSRR